MDTDWLGQEQKALDTAAQLMNLAKAAGADVAEATFSYSLQADLTYRDGEVSELNQSEDLGLGLRVWAGDRVAYLSGNRLDTAGLKDLAEQAVQRARHLPGSPDVDLPLIPDVPGPGPEVDESELSLTDMRNQAAALYDQAMAVSGIVNSDGGNVGWSRARSALVASNGLSFSSQFSHFYRGISVQAGQGGDQVRAHDFSTKTHLQDVRLVPALAQRATDKALARVGARPVAGFTGPVIFDAPMAKSLIAGFIGAINGAAIAKGQSFLKDALETQVFPETVQICDDPTLSRGLGSRVIDREGHVPNSINLIDQGRLTTWLLDRRSAHKLGLKTNARASHGGGGIMSPSSTNVLVSGGHGSQADLIAGVDRGLLITEMMGQGLNPLTGDYSRGAGGFLIENGHLTQPVQAMTVAGHMRGMFSDLVLAGDTDQNGSMYVPSILIPNLAIAGAD